MKKKPSRDPIAAFEREARATTRVGVGSRCVECGEDRPLALIPGTIPGFARIASGNNLAGYHSTIITRQAKPTIRPPYRHQSMTIEPD